jgi:hypothetical protein
MRARRGDLATPEGNCRDVVSSPRRSGCPRRRHQLGLDLELDLLAHQDATRDLDG